MGIIAVRLLGGTDYVIPDRRRSQNDEVNIKTLFADDEKQKRKHRLDALSRQGRDFIEKLLKKWELGDESSRSDLMGNENPTEKEIVGLVTSERPSAAEALALAKEWKASLPVSGPVSGQGGPV